MFPEDDKRLAMACAEGDSVAFDRLYHRYASKMLVVCYRYARDRDEANDLLQEGFIRVFEQIHTFRGAGSLEGWIRRVIVSVALANYQRNYVARNQTVSLSDDRSEDDQPFTAEDITSQISFNDMLRMIQNLTPAYRMVFNLYVFEGMKHHEIASQLGISEGTSKSNLAQARRILQERITKVMFDV
jgi:RNA polymerase sigma-70 factor (ECF subfamily)